MTRSTATPLPKYGVDELIYQKKVFLIWCGDKGGNYRNDVRDFFHFISKVIIAPVSIIASSTVNSLDFQLEKKWFGGGLERES